MFLLHTVRLRTHIPPKHIRAPPISMNTNQISFRHPPDIPQITPWHLQGTQHTNRHQQTQTDTARHPKTQTGAVGVCLAYVPWHLLLSVGMSCSLGMSGGVWGMPGGVWRISEWYLWKLEALGCASGVCGFSVVVELSGGIIAN